MAKYSIEFNSKSLYRKVNIKVTIPSLGLKGSMTNPSDYYQNNNKTYPLIIFLCGFGDDNNAWQTNTPIDRYLEENEYAAVYINGENKWYLNYGPLDNYYDFIENDVLDFLYGHFKNLSKNKPLIIAGVSMGGYGAIYHYLKNTSKYSACIALSPATRPDHIDESKYGSLKDLFLKEKDNKLNCYISIGEKDFIIDASRQFDKFLNDNEIGVSYRYIPDYAHEWGLWEKEVKSIFDYLNNLGLKG